ncbi:amidohydrolase family protein [Humisphaera borealis]|uniref:Amidohydrolase family protein n=1 Tax=Humisphaera borealis TaxID=2807512 RepID=A0A7M2WPU6_9BACT|nr:amidohydrolase family protein [Humisphaera borealis]QOV87547.1 amidohydrolase family protein [Humisphaera borealis]
MLQQIVRGPLLIPRDGGSVDFYRDGVLAGDASGVLLFAGDWPALRSQLGSDAPPARMSDGVLLPPLIDIHTHVPQHPIRGRFVEGIPDDAPGGKLIAGLRRNVFPAEEACNDPDHARAVARQFLADTLSHGVVGGAAYMTTSAGATEVALATLPDSWQVGMAMMNQNCPPNLHTDEATVAADIERLARRFGPRSIVTDRFAYAVGSPLRRLASKLAGRLGLRTQTHLNEQVGEKRQIEQVLYSEAASYTDVYRRDGLLDHRCILAHCIQMRPEEWQIVVDTGSVVAHCPTSNLLLGSGVMPLDEVVARGIPYAIATDVGASPTVSMLAEMKRFMTVHERRSKHATAVEALCRATLAPAVILGLDATLGRLEAGRPMSFIEVMPGDTDVAGKTTGEQAIRVILPDDLNSPASAVRRVTLNGKPVHQSAVP